MKSDTVIKVDLARSAYGPWVEAVQGDGGTRCVSVQLMDNGKPWNLSGDAEIAIAYTQPGGTKGLYNKLPDGRSAVSIRGNTVTAILTPQMLSIPGKVQAAVVFTNEKLDQLTTFPFTVSVAENQFAGAQKTEDYIRLQWLEAKLDEYMKKAKDSGVFDGPQGKAFTYADFTPEQLAALIGPQGPIGETGPAGPQGPQGISGKDGKTPVKGVDYGTPEEIAEISTHAVAQVQSQIDSLGADLHANAAADARTKRSLDALWKLNQGISYQFEKDSEKAYSKPIPSGAKLTMVKQTGGRTIVWNQLVGQDTTSVTPVSGNIIVSRISGEWSISISDGTVISVSDGADKVFDVTRMFGAGSEPTSIDDFRSMFPTDYYPYNPGALMSMPVNEIVNSKADGTVINTMEIPASILALDGYGDSADDVFNYVDWESMEYHKRVGRVDLGSLNWASDSVNGRPLFQTIDKIEFAHNTTIEEGKGICPKYPVLSTYSAMNNDSASISWYWYESGKRTPVRVYDSAYTDTAAFKAAMSGVMLYYELAEEEVIDISGLIADTFQEPFTVESGGTLTFKNSNGNGYCVPVPNTEEYIISLAEVNQ